MTFRPARLASALALSSLLLFTHGCYLDHLLDEEGGVDAGPAADRPPIPLDAPIPTDAPVILPPGPLEHPPERPDVEDAAGNTRTFALRDIVLDPTIFRDEGWTRFSYDLDNAVSNSIETASCQGSVVIPDGPRGEDNVFCSKFIEGLQVARGEDLQSFARNYQVSGDRIPIVHISEWNLEDNDPRVSVWLANAGEIRAVSGRSPNWDDTDTAYPVSDDFERGRLGRPRYLDDNAYVAGRFVVAAFPEFELLVPQGADVPPLSVRLADMLLVGQISVDARRLNRAVLTGRWQLVRIQEALSDSGVCAGSQDRVALDLLISQFADIRANSAQDNATPLMQCDSLSTGIGFTGYMVNLGEETRPFGRMVAPSPCG